MKANKNSLHAKLYKFTYSTDFPVNLCPYFWKLVWAVIVFLPNLICQIPYYSFVFFIRQRPHDCSERRAGSIIIYVALAIVWAYLYSTFEFGKAIFTNYAYSEGAAVGGLVINGSIILVAVGLIGIHFIRARSPVKNPPKEKRPNILAEFIKASYNRYCPKIDWE